VLLTVVTLQLVTTHGGDGTFQNYKLQLHIHSLCFSRLDAVMRPCYCRLTPCGTNRQAAVRTANVQLHECTMNGGPAVHADGRTDRHTGSLIVPTWRLHHRATSASRG